MTALSKGQAQEAPSPVRRSCQGDLVGGYALLCGVVAVLGVTLCPSGWGVITRPALGWGGIMAGLMLLTRDSWGKPLLGFWLLAQVPIIIVDLSGPLTRQPGLNVEAVRLGPMTWSGPTVLDVSGYGVNFGPLILLFVVWGVLDKGRFIEAQGRWLKRISEGLRVTFLLSLVIGIGYAGARWGRPLLARKALMVIDSPPPGAQVYLKDRYLGTTPLVITHEKMVEWGLSKPEGPKQCHVSPWWMDTGVFLWGGSSAAEIQFKAPAWCARHYLTMPTPYGVRMVPEMHQGSASNYWSVPLKSREDAGLVLEEPRIEPAICPPGQPLRITARLHRNPADPRIGFPMPAMEGQRAELHLVFANNHSTGYYPTNVDLPAAWTHIGIGQSVTNSFLISPPLGPDTYTVRLSYRLIQETNSPRKFIYGYPCAYGLVEIK